MLPTNPLLNATAPAGPHLPTATLRQYAAGTLAPAARHRVEAHTLACPRCADILEGLLQTSPATTDQALAQLQQRLRRRVQQQAPAALPATRARHRNRWLVPQLAAAAALLFGLVAGGWWTWQQRHASPMASSPVAVAPAAAPTAETPASTVAEAPSAPAAAKTTLATSTRALPATAAPASVARSSRKYSSPIAVARRRLALPAAATEGAAAASAPVAASPAAPAASTYDAAPHPAALASSDSAALSRRAGGVRVETNKAKAAAPPTFVRAAAMPAAPALPPMPQGGYSTWREKIRREAAEFKPDAPDQPLSGSVQLRVLVGADGKIQEIKVLHGLRADYDEEAQRLVCDGPGWVPGIGGGKRAAQAVDVAVPFQ